jgi:hypothetical protein
MNGVAGVGLAPAGARDHQARRGLITLSTQPTRDGYAGEELEIFRRSVIDPVHLTDDLQLASCFDQPVLAQNRIPIAGVLQSPNCGMSYIGEPQVRMQGPGECE